MTKAKAKALAKEVTGKEAATRSRGLAPARENGQWRLVLTVGGSGMTIGLARYALGPRQRHWRRRNT